jgi:uncharacterized protein YyaL (SSP411 family)
MSSSKTFTNRLIQENSPYLLQHAHNPVDWFPWGEEALAKAKAEQKPILVSIGYAACHWCHVMERESFENEATAKLMNDYFVNIKIDREERPDLDHIYMDAVQAMTGSGGWPLNVFLTTDAKPFFGGTYFPPVKAYNRQSWSDVLMGIHQAWVERRTEVESQAENLTQHIDKSNLFSSTATDQLFTQESLTLIGNNILKQADTVWGGFGNAPKFPQTYSIQFLLRHYHFTKDEAALQQALLSLDKMIYGGIYDQLGGGFARYSTDREWLAPHFEKMLYDNALLIGVLSEAYQLTQLPIYQTTITHTIDFLEREMLHEKGGFFAALDADSEGVEGKFYTWSKTEIEAIVGADAPLFCDYYQVSSDGNWEQTNILWVKQPFAAFAQAKGMDEAALSAIFKAAADKLMAERDKRIRPQTDDKILLGWNALMITALCKAYAATGIERYKNLATDTIQFLEENLRDNSQGNWQHTYKNGVAKYPAFLDDYAYLIQAYIHLQEITGSEAYIHQAVAVMNLVMAHFSDADNQFFYYTHQQQQDVIVRKKEVYDGATPSGNAIMALNLHYLGLMLNKAEWRNRAETMLATTGNGAIKYPTSFGAWASLLQIATIGVKEIAVVGKNYANVTKAIVNLYLPNKILQASAVENSAMPLLSGKIALEDTAIYLCENYSCKQPVYDIEAFKNQLR